MATAHRISELQALANNIGFKNANSIILNFSPEFLAKTESADNLVDRCFRIEPLSSLTDDKDVLLLCPVRVLKFYLKILEVPGRANRLFLP